MLNSNVDQRSSKIEYIIDALGLLNIGILCLCYVLWSGDFAEQHLEFSFLPFPIFVGEIFIFFNIILLTIKLFMARPRFKGWLLAATIYMGFVLLKAACGYAQWGTLALRHSALFYYPIFIILVFFFFRKEFFNEIVKIGLFTLLLVLMLRSGYWLFCFICLAGILAGSLKTTRLKVILFCLLALFSPIRELFFVSRMTLLGNIVAILFLLMSLTIILPYSKKVKSIAAAIVILCLSFIILKSVDMSDARSIIDFESMKKTYNECLVTIAEREQSGVPKTEMQQAKLYNPQTVVKLEKNDSFYPKEFLDYTKSKYSKKSHSFMDVIAGFFSKISFRKQPPVDVSSIVPSAPTQISLKSEMVGGQASSSNQISHRQVEPRALTTQPETTTHQPERIQSVSESLPVDPTIEERIVQQGVTTGVFRIFIWKDMFKEYFFNNSWYGLFVGVDFGKPFLSRNLEMLGWAQTEWRRDGWIGAHNSLLEILYRSGLIGVIMIISLFSTVVYMVVTFMSRRSFKGILLCAIVISWIVAANFLLILELPYTAIPFWSLLGLSIAFCYSKDGNQSYV